MSRLSWQVKLPKGLLCTYCANSQSAVLPEVTPPPKAHHPQNPKLLPPGVTAVPANAACPFSLPGANAGREPDIASNAPSPRPSSDRARAILHLRVRRILL